MTDTDAADLTTMSDDRLLLAFGVASTMRSRKTSDYFAELQRRLQRAADPPPCPQCNGSGRAWVNDAAGGFGTTCAGCDGTGAKP